MNEFRSPEKVSYGYVLSPSGSAAERPWSSASFTGSEVSVPGSLASTVILDVRMADEFMQCHVRGALSHPTAWLCQDKQVLALQRAKANPNSRVIVYGHDDRDGATAAQLLAQKGWENIWVLTGGFQKFLEEPSGLGAVVGTPPSHPKAAGKPSFNAATLPKWGKSETFLQGAGSPSAQSVMRREMRCPLWCKSPSAASIKPSAE